jgi:magnesium-transporting ATPase (P-type)
MLVFGKGADSEMNCSNSADFQKSINTMSDEGLRTLIFGYKEIDMNA